MKPRTYWVGIVNDRPHVEVVRDTYGECGRVELFIARRTARQRYESVRRVRLVVEPKPKRGGRRG